MAQVGMHEAKTKLSELVARAARGEDIVIARHGHPVARLVPVERRSSFAELRGSMKGEIVIHDDFDDPLDEDFRDAFGI